MKRCSPFTLRSFRETRQISQYEPRTQFARTTILFRHPSRRVCLALGSNNSIREINLCSVRLFCLCCCPSRRILVKVPSLLPIDILLQWYPFFPTPLPLNRRRQSEVDVDEGHLSPHDDPLALRHGCRSRQYPQLVNRPQAYCSSQLAVAL